MFKFLSAIAFSNDGINVIFAEAGQVHSVCADLVPPFLEAGRIVEATPEEIAAAQAAQDATDPAPGDDAKAAAFAAEVAAKEARAAYKTAKQEGAAPEVLAELKAAATAATEAAKAAAALAAQ